MDQGLAWPFLHDFGGKKEKEKKERNHCLEIIIAHEGLIESHMSAS